MRSDLFGWFNWRTHLTECVVEHIYRAGLYHGRTTHTLPQNLPLWNNCFYLTYLYGTMVPGVHAMIMRYIRWFTIWRSYATESEWLLYEPFTKILELNLRERGYMQWMNMCNKEVLRRLFQCSTMCPGRGGGILKTRKQTTGRHARNEPIRGGLTTRSVQVFWSKYYLCCYSVLFFYLEMLLESFLAVLYWLLDRSHKLVHQGLQEPEHQARCMYNVAL